MKKTYEKMEAVKVSFNSKEQMALAGVTGSAPCDYGVVSGVGGNRYANLSNGTCNPDPSGLGTNEKYLAGAA